MRCSERYASNSLLLEFAAARCEVVQHDFRNPQSIELMILAFKYEIYFGFLFGGVAPICEYIFRLLLKIRISEFDFDPWKQLDKLLSSIYRKIHIHMRSLFFCSLLL